MRLEDLLRDIPVGTIPNDFKEREITSVSCDSRHVARGGLFVALKGTSLNGADFIAEAIQNGANVIIKNSHPLNIQASPDVCVLSAENPKNVLLHVAQRFYNFPSSSIKTIGVTGTNGKTTISYLLESILNQNGKKSAVIGTVNYRIGPKVLPSKNTTPGLLENQHYLSLMIKEKCEYCVMEVSSHALDQGRIDGIDFSAAIFTNLTGDHMDYHRTMENYFEAKAKLFIRLKANAFAVINTDDSYGERLLSLAKGKIIRFGMNQEKADVCASDIFLTLSGTKFTLHSPQGSIALETPLIGRHNVSNILAAAATCLYQDINLQDIKRGVESLRGVPGRLQRVEAGQDFFVYVDYAHTEDALKNVLSNLRAVNKAKIILVFGCGGDRDRTKRPKMGKVASELADVLMITSDNPRSESPESIAQEIAQGIKGKEFEVVLDRKEAIHKALSLAQSGDVVLIAGKGHENYQIFKDKTVHFDDTEVVKDFLACSR